MSTDPSAAIKSTFHPPSQRPGIISGAPNFDPGICVSSRPNAGCKSSHTYFHLDITMGFGRGKFAKVLHKSRQSPDKMSVAAVRKLTVCTISDPLSIMTASTLFPLPPSQGPNCQQTLRLLLNARHDMLEESLWVPPCVLQRSPLNRFGDTTQ